MAVPLCIRTAADIAYEAYKDHSLFAETEDAAQLSNLRYHPVTYNDIVTGNSDITPFPDRWDGTPTSGSFGRGNNARTYILRGYSSHSPESEMGFVQEGSGRRKGELLIAFRGSNRTSDYFLIDLAAALGVSPCGFAVHGGFAKVFESIRPQLEEINRLIGPTHTVHCVGHSMGGALATLTAEYYTTGIGMTPYLYTFGAPRVGLVPHTQYMQRKMGERINRYYYASDWITWAPSFPFVHLEGKRLITSSGFKAGHNDYQFSRNLVLAGGGAAKRHGADAWGEAEALIDEGGSAGGGWGLESRALRCFMYALNKILYLIGMPINAGLLAGFTVIDQIAAYLAFFVKRGGDRAPLVLRWLMGAARALGKIIRDPRRCGDLEGVFKYILNILLTSLMNAVDRQMYDLNRYADMVKRTAHNMTHFD